MGFIVQTLPPVAHDAQTHLMWFYLRFHEVMFILLLNREFVLFVPKQNSNLEDNNLTEAVSPTLRVPMEDFLEIDANRFNSQMMLNVWNKGDENLSINLRKLYMFSFIHTNKIL